MTYTALPTVSWQCFSIGTGRGGPDFHTPEEKYAVEESLLLLVLVFPPVIRRPSSVIVPAVTCLASIMLGCLVHTPPTREWQLDIAKPLPLTVTKPNFTMEDIPPALSLNKTRLS